MFDVTQPYICESFAFSFQWVIYTKNINPKKCLLNFKIYLYSLSSSLLCLIFITPMPAQLQMTLLHDKWRKKKSGMCVNVCSLETFTGCQQVEHKIRRFPEGRSLLCLVVSGLKYSQMYQRTQKSDISYSHKDQLNSCNSRWMDGQTESLLYYYLISSLQEIIVSSLAFLVLGFWPTKHNNP